MDLKDNVIRLQQDLITTNKEMSGIFKTVTELGKKYSFLAVATTACVIFTHKRIKKLEEKTEELNEQIEELKNMKGE
jgi:archaellum component FlaC